MENNPYIGRFAPTPSGSLHFGSLVTAVASYCHARSRGGRWLLRVEDVDTPRAVMGAADDILRTLEAFGFEWDGEVLYQSQRFGAYEEIIQRLLTQGSLYRCECSRKSLMAEKLPHGPLGMIYPGHCRHRNLTNRSASLRLDVTRAGAQSFDDDVFGPFSLNVTHDVGDMVMKRVDGIYAYHLAVVVDDDAQGINHIVRGVDLLEVTSLHLFLYRLLQLPIPGYLHVPLVKTREGKKLSKQTGAKALDKHKAGELLVSALRFLGQEADDALWTCSPSEILRQAVTAWDADKISTQ